MFESLDLFVVFDDLVELAEFSFLVFVELFHDELLSVDAVVHLFLELLERSGHPVCVVLGRPYSLRAQLPGYLTPDFPHFEVRVHLDHFQLLLLLGSQVVARETDPIEH